MPGSVWPRSAAPPGRQNRQPLRFPLGIGPPRGPRSPREWLTCGPARLVRSAHVEAGHPNLPQQGSSQGHAPSVERPLDGKETPLAPATSLARLRKQVLDLAMSGRMKAAEACRSLGISRSRFYELRARYLTYGEAGLLPK